jgi:ubiquinone/menaquinone biosynthesis C-methylase UbiE
MDGRLTWAKQKWEELMAKHQGYLGAVYEAKGAEDVAALYDKWAASYDSEMAEAGYQHPQACVALFARHVMRGAAPVLDAGAGTGLIGQWLQTLGYPDVEALDISGGMLDVARSKNLYSAYHQLALGGPLPFADGAYAGVICAGVFTSGHVGPEGLDELVRVCAVNGTVALTVKGTLWDNGFAARVEDFVRQGVVEIAELTEPYVSMPGDAATTPSMGVALRVVLSASKD